MSWHLKKTKTTKQADCIARSVVLGKSRETMREQPMACLSKGIDLENANFA